MAPVLDLRDAEEFLRSNCADSVNIPFAELPSRMYELPGKGQELRIFHPDPATLMRASAFLRSRGYLVREIPKLELDSSGPTRLRLWRPSPLLEEALELYEGEPGTAADLACGSGREAVTLAGRGWQVDAIDVLPDALEQAKALAGRNGVSVRTIQCDLRRQGMAWGGKYNLASMFRFWHAPLIPQVVDALVPGGMLIIEAFHRDDLLGRGHCVSEEELRQLSAGMEIKLLRRSQHHGRTFAQLVAIKS